MPYEMPNFAGNIAQMFAMGQQAAAQNRQNKLLEMQQQQMQQQQAVTQAEQQYEMGNTAPLQQAAPWLFQQKEAARQEKASTLAKNKATFEILGEGPNWTPERLGRLYQVNPEKAIEIEKHVAGLAAGPAQDPMNSIKARAAAMMGAGSIVDAQNRPDWGRWLAKAAQQSGQGINITLGQGEGAISERGATQQAGEALGFSDLAQMAAGIAAVPGLESLVGPDAASREKRIASIAGIKAGIRQITGADLSKASPEDREFMRQRSAVKTQLGLLRSLGGKQSEDGKTTEIGQMLSGIAIEPSYDELMGSLGVLAPYASGEARQALDVAVKRRVSPEILGELPGDITPQQQPQAKPQGPSDADLLAALKNRMAASGKSADEILAAARAMGLVQ